MSRQDILGVVLIVALVSFLGAMGALGYYLGNAEPRHPDTLCPALRSVPHTVLLVDRTDPLTGEHAALVLKTIERLEGSLGVEERLSLFLIVGHAPVVPTPVFSLCKPRDGIDANALYENKRLLGLEYAKRFGGPLSLVVETLEEPAQEATSPIMETIQAIARRPDFAPRVGARILMIVSDLLQNVPEYSHYRSTADYEAFRTLPGNDLPISSIRGEAWPFFWGCRTVAEPSLPQPPINATWPVRFFPENHWRI